MYIFPYFILRVGGLSYDDLSKLEIKESFDLLESILQKQDFLRSQRTLLIQKIDEEIRIINDFNEKKKLLKLKRRISASSQISTQENTLINHKLFFEIESYEKNRDSIKKLNIKAELSFDSELKLIRKNLRSFTKSNVLKNGLLLSSQSFIDRIEKYISPLNNKNNKKTIQTELTLVRYLSRICTKTSPFSTFTNVSLGKIDNLKKKWLHFENPSPNVNSRVSLNALLINHFQELLIRIPEVNLYMKIKVNPTLIKDKKYLLALISKSGIELFQKTKSESSILKIIEIIDREKNICVHNLLELFPINNPKLLPYIYQLLDYGFLEYEKIALGNTSNWHLELIQYLEQIKIKDELIQDIINVFNQSDQDIRLYESSDYKERRVILNQLFDRLKDCHETVYRRSNINETEKEALKFNFSKENIIFENVYSNISPVINSTDINPILTKISSLIDAFEDFDFSSKNKTSLSNFINKNGIRKFPISVTQFYYLYLTKSNSKWKNYTSLISKKKIKINENKYIEERNAEIKKNILEGLNEKKVSKQHDIYINLKDLNKGEIPNNKTIESYGIFGQFYLYNEDGKDKLRIVLNSLFPGYGKLFGRYLFDLDKKLTNAITLWNSTQKNNNELYIENTDSTYNNANIHPVVLDNELDLHGVNGSELSDNRISLKNLDINIIKDKICLIDRATNKECYVFDIGFQPIISRSKFYNFLNKFTKMNLINFSGLLNLVNAKFVHVVNDNVKIIPRVVYEDQIVLQRKEWLLNKNSIPIKLSNESNWEYFLKLNEWRIDYNIPNEVFFRISNRDNISSPLKNKLKFHDYKPQYLSFKSPHLILLFEKQIKKSLETIIITEMLPNSEELIKIKNKKYCSEFMFQWYKKHPSIKTA